MSRLSNTVVSPRHITARNNPFRTCRVESSIRFQPAWLDTSWQEIMERFDSLRSSHSRCTVVGPHGTGKTTFFEDFELRLRDRGHEVLRLSLHLTVDSRAELPTIPDEVHPDTIVLLDSAGVIGWRAWSPLPLRTWNQRRSWRDKFRRLSCCQIVESRHRRNSNPVLLQTGSSPEMLEAIIRRLDPEWQISSTEIRTLYQRRKGNIRESLRECFDLKSA